MSKFTFEEFKNLLLQAKNFYSFKTFENYKNSESFIIMRHDICPGVGNPLKLATIESELSIQATFFFSLDSNFYNFFSENIQSIVKQLRSLNHKIGIHFDVNKYHSEEEIMFNLSHQKEIFSNILGNAPSSFSFHNPVKDSISFFNKESYLGMCNTYSNYFMNEIGYCSDSNGLWRYESAFDLVKNKKYKNLQILIHPIWWAENVKTPYDKVSKDLDENSAKILEKWVKNRNKRGRKVEGLAEGNNK